MKWLLLLTLLGSLASASGFDTVVIDAGHGGRDCGGIPGQRVGEKDLTLDVAVRLRDLLKSDGLKTVMTRADDTFILLPQRSALANAQRNALFVSIHFNSALRSGADGIETYYYNPQAAGVAARIQAQLMHVETGENRGVKRRGYYVLRKTRIPAVLAECGFLTNRSEAALCQTAAHRQELASALAKAIKASR